MNRLRSPRNRPFACALVRSSTPKLRARIKVLSRSKPARSWPLRFPVLRLRFSVIRPPLLLFSARGSKGRPHPRRRLRPPFSGKEREVRLSIPRPSVPRGRPPLRTLGFRVPRPRVPRLRTPSDSTSRDRRSVRARARAKSATRTTRTRERETLSPKSRLLAKSSS